FKRALEQLEGAPLIVYRRHSTCLRDRKSTRLNSSHVSTSYAVFCLKKKKTYNTPPKWPGARKRMRKHRALVASDENAQKLDTEREFWHDESYCAAVDSRAHFRNLAP